MKTRISNAKIACLDINLQKTRMHLGVQILIDDPNQLEEIRKRYVYHSIRRGYLLIGAAERLRSLSSGFARSLELVLMSF